jgi:hypothetical protein
LKRVLDHAVRRKFIEHNPMGSVQMPRNPADPKAADDIVIFQPHEIRALIETSTSERDKILLLTAALTGARPG